MNEPPNVVMVRSGLRGVGPMNLVGQKLIPLIAKQRPQIIRLNQEFALARIRFAFGLDLQANERRSGHVRRVARLFEKVRKDEPGEVVVRRGNHSLQEGVVVGHGGPGC